MSPMIYLDNSSTTPVDPWVKQRMLACLDACGDFANPSSTHSMGLAANALLQEARTQVAAYLNAPPDAIVWTSGATESINLALAGVAQYYAHSGRHLITFATEHKAVLDTCSALSKQGFEVTVLPVSAAGEISLEALAQAIRPDTLLVSMMHVNNETGVIHDIAAVAACCRAHHTLLHVDAAQSVGKLSLDVQASGVDLVSLSAHKVYGPKGVGALYIKPFPRVRLQPLLFGGGQQRGLRAGTLPTHQIVGMGTAYALASKKREADFHKAQRQSAQIHQALMALPGVSCNGCGTARVPHINNYSIAGIDGEALFAALPELIFSSGSACNSVSTAPSHVLTAMGVPKYLARASFRLSVGRFTEDATLNQALTLLCEQIQRLRAIAPQEALYVV